jgi:hypothetical protein
MEKARVGLIGLGFGSEFIPIYQAHPKTSSRGDLSANEEQPG